MRLGDGAAFRENMRAVEQLVRCEIEPVYRVGRDHPAVDLEGDVVLGDVDAIVTGPQAVARTPGAPHVPVAPGLVVLLVSPGHREGQAFLDESLARPAQRLELGARAGSAVRAHELDHLRDDQSCRLGNRRMRIAPKVRVAVSSGGCDARVFTRGREAERAQALAVPNPLLPGIGPGLAQQRGVAIAIPGPELLADRVLLVALRRARRRCPGLLRRRCDRRVPRRRSLLVLGDVTEDRGPMVLVREPPGLIDHRHHRARLGRAHAGVERHRCRCRSGRGREPGSGGRCVGAAEGLCQRLHALSWRHHDAPTATAAAIEPPHAQRNAALGPAREVGGEVLPDDSGVTVQDAGGGRRGYPPLPHHAALPCSPTAGAASKGLRPVV